MVYCYSVLGLQTAASTNELRGLRLGDVDLFQGVLQVRSASAKNKYRIRTIPLGTAEARKCVERLMSRAQQLGSRHPEHYLFPFRVAGSEYDPKRSMTMWGMRKLWEEVRDVAGLPWLRLYDLRHTGLTRMAERGVPVHVMMAFAGHISMRMQQHYVSVSGASMREWAERVWSEDAPARRPPQSVRPGARKRAPVVF